MLGSWTVWHAGSLVACSVCCLSLTGCGGQEFSSAGSGGSSSTAGSSSAGSKNTGGKSNGGNGNGNAGDAVGGGPDTAGTGGTGGVVSGTCDCPAGHYCRDASPDCFDCAELSRLRFTAPERLDAVSSGNQPSRFPRAGGESADLLYNVAGLGLRYTTDSSTSAGSSVAMTMAQDSAPLLLAENVDVSGPGQAFNFAFDRATEMGKRKLLFGVWQAGLTIAQQAPAPFNGPGMMDVSIAIASHPTADGVARGYWMSDRDSNLGLQLITMTLTDNGVGGPVDLTVGQVDCPPDAKTDLTPWVTPDGKILLFNNTRVDGNCSTTNQGKDLYTALLQTTTGQPSSPAVPVADVNSPGNDTDPSFSADFCELYFASDRAGSYAVYRAHRR